jgi:adenylate cyclase
MNAGDEHGQAGNERLRRAFAAEEEVGVRLGARARWLVLSVIAVWIGIENDWPEALFYHAFVIAFIATGAAPVLLIRAGRLVEWHRYLFPFLDMLLMTLLLLVPNPLDADRFPPPATLRFRNEIYFFLLLSSSVFTYSPRIVLWTGFSGVLCWSVGTLVIYFLPGSLGEPPPELLEGLSGEEKLAVLFDMRRVYLGILVRQVIVLVLTAAGLALFVNRVCQLVAKHADSERQRTNLSRYFSANMIDELAELDEPLGATRQQDVAVLFADLVGFTSLSEAMPPEELIEMLREFHGRMERTVFANQGTLDKYLGDGIMATFGTPRVGDRDATNALSCARSMIESVGQWNERRAAAHLPSLQIAIGVHYGTVVLGDIGGDQRLEFAVLGDTVNTASRLEELTRSTPSPLLVSDALVSAVRREAGDSMGLLGDLTRHTREELRGRSESFQIWRLAP